MNHTEAYPGETGGRAGPDHRSTAPEKGKPPHPLAAWALATVRIIWFSVRHPGRAAWIDHRTGRAWPADRGEEKPNHEEADGQAHRRAEG